jgi:hypothetical protein
LNSEKKQRLVSFGRIGYWRRAHTNARAMATLLLRAHAYPLARRPPPPRAASARRRISTRASSSRPSLRRNRKGDGRGTDPFVSLHGCHTQGCCTNDLVASLEARAERAAGITRDGGIPLVEDVSLRECPDGDILTAIAHRAGEIHVGSLAADILWEWYVYFLYFNPRRMGN